MIISRKSQIPDGHEETAALIRQALEALMGVEVSYMDAHLLASVLLDQRTSLWTRDKRLKLAARKAGAALYDPFHS